MKKMTKRIMALMLSLAMILGCVPSFTTVVKAGTNSNVYVNLVNEFFFENTRVDSRGNGAVPLGIKVGEIPFMEDNNYGKNRIEVYDKKLYQKEVLVDPSKYSCTATWWDHDFKTQYGDDHVINSGIYLKIVVSFNDETLKETYCDTNQYDAGFRINGETGRSCLSYSTIASDKSQGTITVYFGIGVGENYNYKNVNFSMPTFKAEDPIPTKESFVDSGWPVENVVVKNIDDLIQQTSDLTLDETKKYLVQIKVNRKYFGDLEQVKINGTEISKQSDPAQYDTSSWEVTSPRTELTINYILEPAPAEDIIKLTNIADQTNSSDIKVEKLILTDTDDVNHVLNADKANIVVQKNGSSYTGKLSKDDDYSLNITTDSLLDFEPALDLTKINKQTDDYKLRIDGVDTPDWDASITDISTTNNGVNIKIDLKSKILKEVYLNAVGTLVGGDTNPTLKYTTTSSDYTSNENTTPVTWTQENGSLVDTFVKDEAYYKEITIIAEGNKEFSENINNENKQNIKLPSDLGTVANITREDAKTLKIKIKSIATGKSVSVNYPTVTSLTNLLELDDTDFTTTGAKSYDFNLEWLTSLTQDMTLGGQILLRHEFDIQTTEEAEKVENVYLNGIKISDTYKIDSSELDTFMKDHDFAYFIQNQFVTLYEKFDFGVDYSANFTVAPGTTIEALKQSFTSNFNESPDIWVYEMNGGVRNDRPLLESDTLVAGKTYCVSISVDSKYDVNAIKTLTVNNVSLPRYGSLEGRLHAYEVGWPSEILHYIDCYYVFDCKNQSSGGGSRKKKTEEPKQEEPTKTPEEKLKEELLKDDVKKANSNEGEKINPSAKFINGYDDGTFKAERKVNNIELMSMVTELFDNVEIKETKDLNQGENYWGQEIIDKANALGLVPGNKDDKNYNLTDEVTRGDLAVVVYNLVKDFSNAPSLKDRDNCKDAIGTGYEKEAAKLLELGIFKGYDDGLFHGDYTLTRAEAVVVINRALKSLGFEINMPKISLSFPDLDPSHWAYAEIMYASNK